MAEGLVGGEAFAVDASIIVADAKRRRGLDDEAFGGATPVEPKAISPTDPAA